MALDIDPTLPGMPPEITDMIVGDAVKVPYQPNGAKIWPGHGTRVVPMQRELSLRLFFPPQVPGTTGNPHVQHPSDWRRSMDVITPFYGSNRALRPTAREMFFKVNTFVMEPDLCIALRRWVGGQTPPHSDRLQNLRPHLEQMHHLRYEIRDPLASFPGVQGPQLDHIQMNALTHVMRLLPRLRSLEIAIYGWTRGKEDETLDGGHTGNVPAVRAMIDASLDNFYTGILARMPKTNASVPVAKRPNLKVTIRNNKACKMFNPALVDHFLIFEYVGRLDFVEVDGTALTPDEQKSLLLATDYCEMRIA